MASEIQSIILDDFTVTSTKQMANDSAVTLDERMRLIVKPAPKYVPAKLWFKLAAMFLVVEKRNNIRKGTWNER